MCLMCVPVAGAGRAIRLTSTDRSAGVDVLQLLNADVSRWSGGARSWSPGAALRVVPRSPKVRAHRLTSAYQSAVAADGPVGFWRLGESPGGDGRCRCER